MNLPSVNVPSCKEGGPVQVKFKISSFGLRTQTGGVTHIFRFTSFSLFLSLSEEIGDQKITRTTVGMKRRVTTSNLAKPGNLANPMCICVHKRKPFLLQRALFLPQFLLLPFLLFLSLFLTSFFLRTEAFSFIVFSKERKQKKRRKKEKQGKKK